ELTASIARAACTRMADRPRPLRLWADGNTFRCTVADGGRQRINQTIQSGVELLGEPFLAADVELMRLLLAAASSLGLRAEHQPTLLVGHHGILQHLLQDLPPLQRDQARKALTSYDPLSLKQLAVDADQRALLLDLLAWRGEPRAVLTRLEQRLGSLPLVQDLSTVLDLVAPAAQRLGVQLQLDPTFQPHFNLYDGLVLKLVCQGPEVPVAIASGGRYDALVGRFSTPDSLRTLPAAGVGFGFDVESVRELLQANDDGPDPVLIAYASEGQLAQALEQLDALHGEGTPAELLSWPVDDRGVAEQLASERGCSRVHWLDR
ncbi:MAG: ATP phosphoribosyltransferase regulatory subunit, partial [Cyanobacteria bacterium K_DeepCast_35m_m2_023]|nr:ATP phosphoribosyltransferase regulatory subunit [Cyanobacteria bacterium K_DeepCast_35m_m2_023]